MPRLSVIDFPQELTRAYDNVCVLGSDSFGDVFRASTRPPRPEGFPAEVAIRVIRAPEDGFNHELQAELMNHFRCYCPHVVLDVIVVPSRVAIVMELVSGGDLFDLVRDSQQGVPEDKVRWIFQQVMLGIFYLHCLGIPQKNIKLEKLLLVDAHADWPRVKFAAFGYSTSSRLDEDDCLMGMWSNMAPEVLRGSDRMYDRTKVDMWSCGIILYTMLFRRHPFHSLPDDGEDSPEWDLRRMMDGRFELPANRRISHNCQDLLRHLFAADPAERFSAERCLTHPWFQEGLPRDAVSQVHDVLQRTDVRWRSGRQQAFERKMRGSDGFSNRSSWGTSRAQA